MGLSSFKSAYDVWLEKLGKVGPGHAGEAANLGNKLEPAVLAMACDRLGPILKNQTRRVKGSPIVCHVDGIVRRSGEPVEAKTSGLLSPLRDDWGDEGTDEIPDYAWVQAQTHILATDRKCCHVPALLGGKGFRMYCVPRNEEVIVEILTAATNFWIENVLQQTPPEGSLPTLDMAKRIHRVPEKVVSIDPALILAWTAAKQVLKDAESHEEQAKVAVIAALGDAEGSEGTPFGTITYMEQERKEYVVSASKYRTLRLKKA
jgi:predicted phage-related endonuclease